MRNGVVWMESSQPPLAMVGCLCSGSAYCGRQPQASKQNAIYQYCEFEER